MLRRPNRFRVQHLTKPGGSLMRAARIVHSYS
jgi:hypothetical protein